jgi:hypothetical protein
MNGTSMLNDDDLLSAGFASPAATPEEDPALVFDSSFVSAAADRAPSAPAIAPPAPSDCILKLATPTLVMESREVATILQLLETDER